MSRFSRWPLFIALIVSGLMIAGCDTGTALTGADAPAFDMAAKVGDAPDASGLYVVRFQDQYFGVAIANEDGLATLLGWSQDQFLEYCASLPPPDWVGPWPDPIVYPEGELTDVMRVTNPQDEERLKWLRQGTIHATVFGLAPYGIRRMCHMVAYVDPIAYGEVEYQETDNDRLGTAFGSETRHTNAWSTLIHGKLNDGTTPFHYGQQCQGNDRRGMRCNTNAGLQGYSPYALYPANGHYYRVIDAHVPWYQANGFASAQMYDECPGHLATLTSAGENAFVANTFPRATYFGYWLGGFQPEFSPEPDGGWTWVTGEPWGYTNWAGGEPNDAGGDEQSLQFAPPIWYGEPAPPAGTWNDQNWDDIPLMDIGWVPGGFVIEYECF